MALLQEFEEDLDNWGELLAGIVEVLLPLKAVLLEWFAPSVSLAALESALSAAHYHVAVVESAVEPVAAAVVQAVAVVVAAVDVLPKVAVAQSVFVAVQIVVVDVDDIVPPFVSIDFEGIEDYHPSTVLVVVDPPVVCAVAPCVAVQVAYGVPHESVTLAQLEACVPVTELDLAKEVDHLHLLL